MGRLLDEDAVIKVLERWQKAFRENSHHVSASDLSLVVKDVRELPTAQPEPQWIPVSERLPEEYGEYLVTKRTIGWNCEEYDVNDIAYFDDDGFHKADRIIAWMPLPEAYEPNK